MNLTDHFLIAMPNIGDPFFAESVVYLCQHDDDGAFGIIINKPTPISLDLIFAPTKTESFGQLRQEAVMLGGPVQLDRGFVVHSPIGSWQSTLSVNDHIGMTTSRDILEKLDEPQAVEQAIITIGYSSWSAGQLEKELAENSWLTVAADSNILFNTPSEKRYQAALAKLGITPTQLMNGAGHA